MMLVCDGCEVMEFLQCIGKFVCALCLDLILLDLGLLRKDGCEVFVVIKDDYDLRSIFIVVLMFLIDEGDWIKCELFMIVGYMMKFVDIDQFLGLVKELKCFWYVDVIFFIV